MQNMNICKEVLHLFLQDTIEIKSITPQSTIDSFLKSKAVRLDVLVEDRYGNHYDIEMQVVNSDSIPKRMRMYQASIDTASFGKGKKYKEAKKTIIIFICISDPIGRGFPIYTFKNLCAQDHTIALDDETLKIVVAPQNWKKVKNNDDLKSLLRYLWEGVKTDAFTEEVDMCVTDIKYDQVISNESLSYYCELEDAEERGREEGREEGRFEEKCTIARLMKEEGYSIEEIQKISKLSRVEIQQL